MDLQQLVKVLEASLDPRQNKQGDKQSSYIITKPFNADHSLAELAIRQEEKKPNFSLSLLQIVATEIYGGTTRLASALYFKNYIKRNWTVSTKFHTWCTYKWEADGAIHRTKMASIGFPKTKSSRSKESSLDS